MEVERATEVSGRSQERWDSNERYSVSPARHMKCQNVWQKQKISIKMSLGAQVMNFMCKSVTNGPYATCETQRELIFRVVTVTHRKL